MEKKGGAVFEPPPFLLLIDRTCAAFRFFIRRQDGFRNEITSHSGRDIDQHPHVAGCPFTALSDNLPDTAAQGMPGMIDEDQIS